MPPWTVLGVSLPFFFRLIRAKARSLSDNSRVMRALTSGGWPGALAGRGRCREEDEDEEEDLEASWCVIDVRGS